jgi:hypothetical protein
MTHSRLFLFRSSLFDRSRPVHNLAMRKSSHPHNAWPIKYLTGETLFPVNGHYVVLAQQEKIPVLSNAAHWLVVTGHIRRLRQMGSIARWTSAGEHLVWREARCALPQDARRGCSLGVWVSAG